MLLYHLAHSITTINLLHLPNSWPGRHTYWVALWAIHIQIFGLEPIIDFLFWPHLTQIIIIHQLWGGISKVWDKGGIDNQSFSWCFEYVCILLYTMITRESLEQENTNIIGIHACLEHFFKTIEPSTQKSNNACIKQMCLLVYQSS